MKRDHFFHTLRFLHVSDNMNHPDKKDNNYDRLSKITTLFDQLMTSVLNFTIHLNI